MKPVYYIEYSSPMDDYQSIFLAGPSNREGPTPWRQEALALLDKGGFEGTVFIPEFEPDHGWWDTAGYENVEHLWEWEHWALTVSSFTLFWVPRTLPDYPGFTTNVEFGLICEKYPRSSISLGTPPDAVSVKYLRWLATKQGIPVYDSLSEQIAGFLKDNRGKLHEP